MLPSDAETLAGALALFSGNLPREAIDLLMVASQVPDVPLPPNASLVQQKLRLPNAGAYHVDTCCSSFVTMLEIAANARNDMLEAVNHAVEKAGISIQEADFFVTHQPVYWAADAWREQLGILREKFHETFQKYGNIANCSAAVNLLEAIELKLAKEGDVVLMASSGAGENHIAVLERLHPRLIHFLHHPK